MATIDHGFKHGVARERLFARYPMVLFFVLAFVLTWGYFWLIWAPLGLPASLIALGGFGPSIAAFLVLAITSGKLGVLRLLRSIVYARDHGAALARVSRKGKTKNEMGACDKDFSKPDLRGLISTATLLRA